MMKKIILPTLFFLFSFLLISCGEISISESNELSDSDHVIKWFDCLNGDEMVVTFRWRPEQMEAVIDKEVVPLYEGMPIWSAYFCDLTGDGIPELCSTLSSGSGMIDNRIIIYDYAGGASYELSDRGNFDYILNMREDSLVVEKRVYMQDEMVESGELVFRDDTIQIITE